MGKTIKMKKYHADLDPSEDSGSELERWPGKIIWIRLAVCILGGLVGALFIVSMIVIIVNKIMEQ